MTEQQAEPGSQAESQDPLAVAAALRAEAAAIEASVPPAPGTSRWRVEPPHTGFSFGSISLSGGEYRPVPDVLLASVLQAAAEAGVTLTAQEG